MGCPQRKSDQIQKISINKFKIHEGIMLVSMQKLKNVNFLTTRDYSCTLFSSTKYLGENNEINVLGTSLNWNRLHRK